MRYILWVFAAAIEMFAAGVGVVAAQFLGTPNWPVVLILAAVALAVASGGAAIAYIGWDEF